MVNKLFLKQNKSLTQIARVMVLVALSGYSATLAWAQSDTNRISGNLAPVGEVCLAGEPCSQAPGAQAAATTITAAPAPVAAAQPAPAAMPEPAAAPAVVDDFDVAGTYQMRCFACHGTGAAGAPVLGDADAWGERMAKGMDVVMANAINGIGAMPARGLCMDCTDSHIEALITYMVDGGQ